MIAIDPVRLARRQMETDRERTGRFPHLLEHKTARMIPSPLALLRGSAPLYYGVLARHPALSEGPPGDGWLVGDCHLENFGAFRTGALSTRAARPVDAIAFDLNDFDDAFIGPWRLDLVRLLTSVILGGRELGTDGRTTLELAEALLDGYVARVFHKRRPPARPHAVSALIEKVQTRSRAELLAARTEIVGGQRRFVRGPRYEPISDKMRARAERAFAKFVKRLPPAQRPPAQAVEVVDAAFRVAGTGSLGCLRIALLVRGRGGPNGGWIFDMKEEGTPSSACLVRPPRLDPADRVVTALGACLASPPRMLGTTTLRGSSMFVRRLAPQEDRVDLQRLAPSDLEPLAGFLGSLLGAAHLRGARRRPSRPWNRKDCGTVLAQAIALAALHEAVYLAYCQLVRT